VSATRAGIMPALTLASMLRTTHRDARTLLTTYLGRHAADRVLAGNIVRRRAEAIRAVVWFGDLVGFTRLSDTVGPDQVLELLNGYAQAQVEEIEANSGHVLKFIGDGILAIFPDDDTTQACHRTLDPGETQAASCRLRGASALLPKSVTNRPLSSPPVQLKPKYCCGKPPPGLELTLLHQRRTGAGRKPEGQRHYSYPASQSPHGCLPPPDDAPEFAEAIGPWGLLCASTIQAGIRVPFINNALQRERL